MSDVKILLVDDDKTNRLMFETMIARFMPECVLHSCNDPAESVALARSLQPDCAILDLFMPGMNGIELCRQLKQDEVTNRFPILLLTAHDVDAKLRVQGLEAGADDFLQRPCDNVELVAKIRVMLRIKRAESELREVNRRLADLAGERSLDLYKSDERFRLLFSTTSDGVLEIEVDDQMMPGRILEANNVVIHELGYSRDELRAMNSRALFPDDRAQGMPVRVESILKHKQLFFETVLITRKGRQRPVGVHVRSFESDDHSITLTAVIHFSPDSEHGATSLEHDVRYRMLAAQTGQMIYDYNLLSREVKYGGAITQVTGYTNEELVQFEPFGSLTFVVEEDRVRIQQDFEEAIKAVSTYQHEYRLLHKSGSYRYVEDLGVALPGEDGRAYRILGTIKDITARVKAEEERRQLEREQLHSQRLESLGVLAGGIAHDFNNILAAIIGLTDMALREIDSDSEIYADLSESLQAAHRAKGLVKQILMFSRQTGEEREPLFLHVVVREALKLLKATLPVNIKIIDNVDVHSGAILANASQMHQIAMNFCTNAAHAMGESGGTLEVRLGDVEVDEHLASHYAKLQPGPYVLLSVYDSGHGMTPNVISRIFDPFYTTKGPGQGTGMGLAVVHGIVMNHGGTVTVESTPGHGSAFHTYLPRIENTMPKERAEPESAPRGTERILFVDDEEPIIRFGKSALTHLGYQVEFCRDGLEALELLQAEASKFDLVITDHMMPRMTGEELTIAIREMNCSIPVIIFTGFSEQLSQEMLEQLGVSEVVMKPVLALDMAKAIRRALD